MLNKEKYAKEIAEIAVNNETIALKDNKPISCRKIKCNDCGKHVLDYGCSIKKLTEWANSEYKEPVLTEEEKEYLSSVIKPFRKKVKHIVKINLLSSPEEQFIRIVIGNLDFINFPNFNKNTGMYKGMEADKLYSLEKLGI